VRAVKVGIPKESGARERRVALTPSAVAELVRTGYEIVIESGAGLLAGHPDAAYEAVGARIAEAWTADVVLKVEPPTLEEARRLNEGATLVSFIHAGRHPELVAALATRKATVLAMERVPRTTIAQKCDALSSMGALTGQRAVLEAATALQRPLGAVFSAAGKVAPAKVLVIGAGVAGLAAIGAAKALGALVRAFDTRLAAKDDVKSLGAEFLELDFRESGEGHGGYAKVMSPEFIAAEMALFAAQAAEVDVVITTALVPGTTAPVLWTRAHVEAMRQGSVVVDLAAHQGGNCEVTRADEVVRHPTATGFVTVLGPTDLASRMAQTASELYAKNLLNLLAELSTASAFDVTPTHEIGGPMLVLLRGEAPPPRAPAAAPPITSFTSTTAATATPSVPRSASHASPPTRAATGAATHTKAPASASKHVAAHPALGSLSHPRPKGARTMVFAGIGLLLVGGWFFLRYATASGAAASPMQLEVERFVDQLAVFVLSCFVGWQVIWNVTPALHTPLMSVTNAISGIIIVGGLLEGSHDGPFDARTVLGLLAVLLATINIAGGFWVTHRMLKMFRK